MKKKITPHILSIPPYISTTWQHIAALNVQERSGSSFLIIELTSGERIEVPNLDLETIEQIFSSHVSYNETNEELKKSLDTVKKNIAHPFLTLRMSNKLTSDGIEKFINVLQHNPEAADSPDLPKEMLDNIAHISQSLGAEDVSLLPRPVTGCNCFFCQISRTILSHIHPTHASIPSNEEIEEVTEEDLRFKNWDVCQKDPHLYEVINPLDTQEHYTVFLGQPIGCTCGDTHCEHIRAVLQS